VGDAYTTNEDTPLNVPSPGILSNDSDPDGDTLTAVLDTGPAHGTLTLNTDGSFSYTPNANYNGADNFTYYANDGTANSNIAAVSLTINPVNDPPVAVDDSYSASEGTPFSVAAPGVLGNDSDVDGDALTAVLDTSTTHGTLSLKADGSFTYNPEANFTGSDSFSYHASDGTANSNVASVTISVSGSPSTLSFLPSDDAYVRSDDSSGNYGSDVALDVREHKRQAAHSYLKFNVSGISGSVSSAKLRLFSTVGTNSNISIYAVSNNYGNSSMPWTEQELTWNNAPGASGSPIATINSVSSGSWVEFDLTQAVISDGVYSFELVNDAPNWAIFNSKEASDNPPELVITQ
jgi:VCBS repeat-containing protein